jgi:hypothetical protein
MRLKTMRFGYLGLSLLLVFSMVNTFADPSVFQREGHVDELQNIAPEKNALDGMPVQPQLAQGRPREFALPDAGPYVLETDSEPGLPSLDSRRRQGRLTQEERRALRQQINEAGLDIYSSRH